MFTTNDVNECWDNFKYIYNKAVQNFVPSHRLKKKCPPWINQELKKMIRQKRALWKKFKQNKSDENHEIGEEDENRYVHLNEINVPLECGKHLK